MNKTMLLTVGALAALTSFGGYKRGALIEEFRFRPEDKAACAAEDGSGGDFAWIADGGKSGDGALRFRSASRKTSALFTRKLDAAKYRGRIVQIEADVKGVAIGAGDQLWNGPKLMFPHKGARGMQHPEIPKEYGSFDWKTAVMVYSFPKDTVELSMTLGLEAAPGEMWVDAVRLYLAEQVDDTTVVAPRNEKAAKIPRGPWYGRHNPKALRGVMSGGDMSEAAFQTLESWKANLIRLQIGIPMHDQKTLEDWYKALEAKLDWAEEILLRCRRHGIKAVIDLHGGPGTVATKYASNIIPDNYDPEPLKEAWRRIAKRLSGYPEVYGYDILNEPCATLKVWDELFLAVTAEIRKIDRKTPVITEFCHRYFEGENVIYSPHFYSPHTYTHCGVSNPDAVRWSYPGYIDGIYWDAEQMRVDLEQWIRFSLAHPDVRLLVGEFSAAVWAKGADKYIRDCIAVFEEYGWDWTYHAFRECPAWDVEYTHVDNYEIWKMKKSATDTQRKIELLKGLAYNAPRKAELRVTTFGKPWQDLSGDGFACACDRAATVNLSSARTDQTVIGFGTCMSELSHEALWLLPEAARAKILDEVFSATGGGFAVIRTPIGASDFSKDFYSYCETPGDFEMKTFSTDHDDATLIPLIREVQKRVPSDVLKVWGSPWCPPRWMKTNRNAVSRPDKVNDLTEEGRIFEGEDGFVCDDAHMKAYALYFRKYVESYRAKGIPLWMVMPQNEFNSAQNFPSCTWSVGQLTKFIGRYLGPALEGSGVELYFGTMERPNAGMLAATLERPAYAKYITGAGFQWAGKDALPKVRAKHPELTYVMTEQECGDGRNDWKHALHCWDLMVHYFTNGVSVYDYWNLALQKDGLSHWGWRQNSLVVVDAETRTAAFSPEYYMLKHLSHYVRRGAKRLVTAGSQADALAFVNPDGSVVVMMANKEAEPKAVVVTLDGTARCVTLPPSAVATLTF